MNKAEKHNLILELNDMLTDEIKEAIGRYDLDLLRRNDFDGVGIAEILCYRRFCKDVQRIKDDNFSYTLVFDDIYSLVELNNILTLRRDKKTIPFKLRPFQQYMIANVICWRQKKDTDILRFRECYLSMGRKNGKTLTLADLLVYNFLLSGLKDANFVIASADEEKSFLCLKDTIKFIRSDDDLDELFFYSDASGFIKDRVNNNECNALSGNPKRDGLALSFAVIDEKNLTNPKLIAAVLDSTVNNKYAQVVEITTAQFEIGSVHHIEYLNNINALKTDTLRDDYLFLLWVPDEDEIHDEQRQFSIEAMRKANPFLLFNEDGTIDEWHTDMYLKKALKACQEGGFAKQNFCTKQLNCWYSAKADEISYEQLEAGDTNLTLEDIVKLGYTDWYVGVDLSSVRDLSSLDFIAVVKKYNGHIVEASDTKGKECIYHTGYHFMPSATLQKHQEADGINYTELVGKELFLTKGSEGEKIHYPEIVNFTRDLQEKHKLIYKVIAADPYNVSQISEGLKELTDTFIIQPQSPQALSQYIESILGMYASNEIFMNLNCNKLFVNAVNSSVINRNASNYCVIEKKAGYSNASQRIDPLDAFVTGVIAPIIDMNNGTSSNDKAMDDFFDIFKEKSD